MTTNHYKLMLRNIYYWVVHKDDEVKLKLSSNSTNSMVDYERVIAGSRLNNSGSFVTGREGPEVCFSSDGELSLTSHGTDHFGFTSKSPVYAKNV